MSSNTVPRAGPILSRYSATMSTSPFFLRNLRRLAGGIPLGVPAATDVVTDTDAEASIPLSPASLTPISLPPSSYAAPDASPTLGDAAATATSMAAAVWRARLAKRAPDADPTTSCGESPPPSSAAPTNDRSAAALMRVGRRRGELETSKSSSEPRAPAASSTSGAPAPLPGVAARDGGAACRAGLATRGPPAPPSSRWNRLPRAGRTPSL
mmetsp:Transcript_17690/g.62285  ORF Transcript_17690/g.62285 Transcript_17690/m.62285 type:complete len:211 (+) Transcript_17690:1345-1977(+)